MRYLLHLVVIGKLLVAFFWGPEQMKIGYLIKNFPIQCLRDGFCMGNAYVLPSNSWTLPCTILVEHKAVVHY
jgi:hypothetical protein